MAEYIDRDAAITAVKAHCPAKYEVAVLARIVCIPAADVAEVRHGHKVTHNRPISEKWATCETVTGELIYVKVHGFIENNPVDYCSVCNSRLDDTFQNFCPHCGAKMDESEGEDDV